MSIGFPTSLDTLLNPLDSTAMNAAGYEHDVQHSNLNDAVEALEAKVGINGSAVNTSLDYLVSNSLLKVNQATAQPIIGGPLTLGNAYGSSVAVGATGFLLAGAANVDAVAGIECKNTNPGTSADIRFAMVSTDGNYTSFAMPGLGNTVAAIFGVARAAGTFLFNSGSGTPRTLGIGTLGASNIVFGTTNTARMTILAAGNIGIGITSPGATLDILSGTGSDTPGTNPLLGIKFSATQAFAFRYNAAGSVLSLDFLYAAAWSSAIAIDRATGYVGFGTVAPGMPLQLNRNGCTTNVVWNSTYFVAVKTSDMADGFGTGFRFRIQDDAGVENSIAGMNAVRDGADNSGKLGLTVYNEGTLATPFTIDHLSNIKMGTSTIGNPTNYTKIEPDGTIVMVGDATVWEDLRVPMTSAKAAGIKDPGFSIFKDNGSGSAGVFLWWFDKASEEELFFMVQLPHSWDGTDITPHIHWVPKTNGALNATVEWGLEYTWADINGTFGNTSIIYTKTTTSGDTTLVAGKHYMSNFSAIANASHTISSMLVCRIFRNATDATDDTYDDDAGLIEIDFHYASDTIGSRTISGK